MLGLLNTVLSRGGSLLTYVKDGLVMANRFLTPPKLTFPVDASAEFNGTSDYITTPNLSIQSSATWTIGAWVYSDLTSPGADYLLTGAKVLRMDSVYTQQTEPLGHITTTTAVLQLAQIL